MTRTLSLITGIAVTAFAVAAPAALAKGQAPRQHLDAVAYFYANEQATLASQSVPGVVSRPDSHEATSQSIGATVSRPDSHEVNPSTSLGATVSRPDSHDVYRPSTYIDAAERAARISATQEPPTVFLFGDPRVTVQPADSSSATGSGRELEWPQIGIGLGVGLVLAFGLLLAIRATRQRPLAH